MLYFLLLENHFCPTFFFSSASSWQIFRNILAHSLSLFFVNILHCSPWHYISFCREGRLTYSIHPFFHSFSLTSCFIAVWFGLYIIVINVFIWSSDLYTDVLAIVHLYELQGWQRLAVHSVSRRHIVVTVLNWTWQFHHIYRFWSVALHLGLGIHISC